MSEIMLLGHKMEHNCIKPLKWLNSVGISGSALAWFKSYLSDRHQFINHHQFVAVNMRYDIDHKCSMEYLKAQY